MENTNRLSFFFHFLVASGQYGFKTAALRRRLEAELQDTEIRVWRFSLGATRIKNNDIKVTEQTLSRPSQTGWAESVVCTRMLRLELAGRQAGRRLRWGTVPSLHTVDI